MKAKLIEDRKLGMRNRKRGLCESELISLMILFHSGQFGNLKSFYVHYAQPYLIDLFPGLTSYNRFVELQPRCTVRFSLAKVNVDDRNLQHMMDMTKDISGKLYGDKSYISKAMADIL